MRVLRHDKQHAGATSNDAAEKRAHAAMNHFSGMAPKEGAYDGQLMDTYGLLAEQAGKLMSERRMLGARYDASRKIDEDFVAIIVEAIRRLRLDKTEYTTARIPCHVSTLTPLWLLFTSPFPSVPAAVAPSDTTFPMPRPEGE